MLTPPDELKVADTIRSAGKDEIHQAFDDAQIQHKCQKKEKFRFISEA
jgi:hypothetical protein